MEIDFLQLKLLVDDSLTKTQKELFDSNVSKSGKRYSLKLKKSLPGIPRAYKAIIYQTKANQVAFYGKRLYDKLNSSKEFNGIICSTTWLSKKEEDLAARLGFLNVNTKLTHIDTGKRNTVLVLDSIGEESRKIKLIKKCISIYINDILQQYVANGDMTEVVEHSIESLRMKFSSKSYREFLQEMSRVYCQYLNKIDWSDQFYVKAINRGKVRFLTHAHIDNLERSKYHETHFISKEALTQLNNGVIKGLRFEHVIPKTSIIQQPLEELSKKGKLSEKKVFDALLDYWWLATITEQEDKKLSQNGFRSKMPEGWGDNVLSRYTKSKIKLFYNPYFTYASWKCH
ncbi:MAG: hypothetical protein RJQ09_19070 [Cyclobacteriaceae bacterium]